MKFAPESPNLVIAGAWNPMILSPQWVASKALDYPPDKHFDVGVELSVDGMAARIPRFTYEGLIVQARPRTLTFTLSVDDFARNEWTLKVAAKILSLLGHTPVTGVGLNFNFVLKSADGPIAATFDPDVDVSSLIADHDAITVSRQWSRAAKTGDRVVNVVGISDATGAKLNINMHHEVTNADAAEKILSRENYWQQLHAEALSIAGGLSKEELEQ